MSLKAKLTSLVLGVIFAMSMMIVGVLSVSQVNLGIGGNVTFTAKGVNCTISEGTLNTGDKPTGTMQGMTFSTTEAIDNTTKLASWTGLDLSYAQHGTGTDKNQLIISFSITNNSESDSLAVSITTKELGTNQNMKDIAVVCPESIAPGATENYSLTFEPISPDVNSSLTGFTANFLIERDETIVPAVDSNGLYGGMQFEKISGKAEASVVITNSSSLRTYLDNGHLVIPNVIKIDGTNYPVTTINKYTDSAEASEVSTTDIFTNSVGGNHYGNVYAEVISIFIPANVKTIEAETFTDFTHLSKVYIDSSEIANDLSLDSRCADLLTNALYVYINDNVENMPTQLGKKFGTAWYQTSGQVAGYTTFSSSSGGTGLN